MRNLRWVKNNEPLLPSAIADQFHSFFNDDVLRKEFVSSRPMVNISEGEEAFNIELAAPGLEKGDFKIDLDKDILTVSVEKSIENKKGDDNYTKREFNYHAFSRSFTIPETVDVDAIKGTYTNGILTVALPKLAEVKNKKRAIEIA